MMNIPRELLLVSFVSGACAMVVELAGARIISPYLGNTIFTWTAVIGLVLGALSLGYYLGGTVADRYNDRKHFSTILLLAGVGTLIIPILGNFIIPFTVLLDLAVASLIASLVLVPASMFYGMVSPYIIKLTSEKGEEGKSAGRIFSISTIGSIIGVLGTGFILIPNIALTHIFVFTGFLMIASSWIVLKKRSRILFFDLAIIAILAAFSLQMGTVSLVNGEVIHEEESAYYHIRVIDTAYHDEDARIMFLDTAPSSAEWEGEPVFRYTIKSREGYELVEDPERALVIGAAAGSQVEDLKKHYPDVTVDGIEIDEKTIELGKEYFSLEDDNRTNIIIDDARRYLKTTDSTYDIVIIDAFRGMTIPYHLATMEFLAELKGRMSDDGVIILNIISAVEGEKSDTFVYIYNTFSTVFDNVVVMPLGENPYAVQNIVIIATDSDVSQFLENHESYEGEIPAVDPLTDELNPIDIYVVR